MKAKQRVSVISVVLLNRHLLQHIDLGKFLGIMSSLQSRYVWAAPQRKQPTIRLVQPPIWTTPVQQPVYGTTYSRPLVVRRIVLGPKPLPPVPTCSNMVYTSPAVLPNLLRRTLPAKAATKLTEAKERGQNPKRTRLSCRTWRWGRGLWAGGSAG